MSHHHSRLQTINLHSQSPVAHCSTLKPAPLFPTWWSEGATKELNLVFHTDRFVWMCTWVCVCVYVCACLCVYIWGVGVPEKVGGGGGGWKGVGLRHGRRTGDRTCHPIRTPTLSHTTNHNRHLFLEHNSKAFQERCLAWSPVTRVLNALFVCWTQTFSPREWLHPLERVEPAIAKVSAHEALVKSKMRAGIVKVALIVTGDSNAVASARARAHTHTHTHTQSELWLSC